MRSAVEQKTELRAMLKDIFLAKAAGESYARLSRAHGYVDGYMRALLEFGVVTKQEIEAMIAEARQALTCADESGPPASAA